MENEIPKGRIIKNISLIRLTNWDLYMSPMSWGNVFPKNNTCPTIHIFHTLADKKMHYADHLGKFSDIFICGPIHEKLIEGKDFIRADFINDRNFVYKINPDKFIELIEQSDITRDNTIDINLISLKNKYLERKTKISEKDYKQSDITNDNSLISHDNTPVREEIIKILKDERFV